MATTTDTKILDVQINYAVLAKQIDDTNKKITDLKNQQIKLNEELAKARTSGNIEAMKKTQEALVENKAQTKLYTEELRVQERTAKQVATVINQTTKDQIGSNTQLRAQLGILTSQYNELSKVERNSAKGTELRDKIKGVSDELKENEKAIGDTRRNVGNYSEAILDAAGKTGLFGGGVSQVTTAMDALKKGTATVKNGVDTLKDGFTIAKSSFFSAGDSIKDFVIGLSKVRSFADLKKVFIDAGTAGVSAMRAVTAAVASTGVGLIVIAVAGIVNQMRQMDPVVEKIEQAFAAVGAVVNVFSKAIFDVVTNFKEVVSNLSFDNFKKGFQETAHEAARAANEAIRIKKIEQEIEDTAANNIVTQKKLTLEAERQRLIAQDRTKSASERIAAVSKAAEIEKENNIITLSLERKRLEVEQAKFAEKQKLNQIGDQEIAQLNEQTAKVLEATEKIKNAELQAAADSTRARRELLNDTLQARIGLLNDELKLAEVNGQKEFDLQRDIALKEKEAKLNVDGLEAIQRLQIQKDYELKLAEIKKSQLDFDKQIAEQRLKLVTDAAQTENDLLLKNQDALLKIRESDSGADLDAKFKLRLDIIDQGLTKELAANQKARENDLLKAEENTNEQLALLSQSNDFQIKSEADKQAEINSIIDEGRSLQSLINQTYNNEDLAAHKKASEDIISATYEAKDARISALIEINELEQAASDPEKANELLALKFERIDLEQDAERLAVENSIATQEEKNAKIALIEKKYNNIRADLTHRLEDQQLAAISNTLGQAAGLFKKHTAAYKALAIAQATIDTYKSATASAAAVAGIVPIGPILAPIAAAVAIAAGLATVSQIIGINTNVGYAKGGKVLSGERINSSHGMTVSRSNGDNLLATVRTGEVILNERQQAMLGGANTFRNIGVPGFADGGFTGSSISLPLFNDANVLQIVDAINNQPQKVVVIDEVNLRQQERVLVESRSNI